MEKYSLLLVKHKVGYSSPEYILKFKGFEVVKKDMSKSNLSGFVDKIENNVAELDLENEQVVFIDLKYLPKDIKEGSYLSIEFIKDKNKTKQIKENVKDLIQELSNNKA